MFPISLEFDFFFRCERFLSIQIISALLPLGYYEFKFNQLSGASGVKVTQLLETAKGCGSSSTGASFLQTLVVLFRVIVCLLGVKAILPR